MCLKVKDILFPFNIFGKKKQCVTFSTADIEVENEKKIITIEFVGDSLELAYTLKYTHYRPIKNAYTYFREKNLYVGSQTATAELNYDKNRYHKYEVLDELLYFNCTNVTFLEVNGLQLI